MKLFCIKSSKPWKDPSVPLVIKGHMYHSTSYMKPPITLGEGIVLDKGIYQLIETGKTWHCESLFIPVEEDQIDEIELVKQRELQTSKT